MKAILMSIQPKWCELIANGTKTIEVRKTAPKEVPFKVYIYQTKKHWIYKLLPWLAKWQAKVVGEFICDKVNFVKYEGSRYIINNDLAYTNGIAVKSCLGYSDMYKYLRNKNGFALHISDLKIYNKPKNLGNDRSARCRKSAGNSLFYRQRIDSRLFPCNPNRKSGFPKAVPWERNNPAGNRRRPSERLVHPVGKAPDICSIRRNPG